MPLRALAHHRRVATPGAIGHTLIRPTSALVDVDTLGVIPVRQRYEHLPTGEWRKVHVPTGVAVDFRVDPYGLVHDEPDLFRRV